MARKKRRPPNSIGVERPRNLISSAAIDFQNKASDFPLQDVRAAWLARRFRLSTLSAIAVAHLLGWGHT